VSPSRVVAALHVGESSGPSRSLAPVLARLAEDGDVVVAVPGRGRVETELGGVARVVVLGHEPLVLPRRAGDLAGVVPRLRRDVRRFRGLLRRERADLAIVATSSLVGLTLAARLEGVPTVFYAAELYRENEFGGPVRSKARRATVRLSARLASVTVSCSEAVAAQLPAGAPSVVVSPTIGPDAVSGDAAALRARHGIPAEGPCLAMLGSLTRGRGHDVAVAALEDLRRDHPDARLVIAGVAHPWEEDYAAEVAALAGRAGVRGAVHLCGFERPGDVFAAADVVLNPARVPEGFGIAAVEALAAGRPVVSTAVGAVPEVLEDGRHALLVPPGRPDALAAAVRRLLDDPALARRLAGQGREHVLATYSEERQVPRFEHAIALATGAARQA
jgi:glycosyltransferase involved in cell wall biosynthesis